MLLLLSLLTGCSMNRVRPLQPGESRILPHAVFVNNDGDALRLREDGPSIVLSPEEHRQYLSEMMNAIRADSASLRDGTRRILIRVHGGLNRLNGSLDTSLRMKDSLDSDPTIRYYPVFINWESGLISSYLEHLFVVRRGERRPREWIWAPFYLAADVGGAVARAPLTWGRQFANFARDGTRNHLDPFAEGDSVGLTISDQEASLFLALNRGAEQDRADSARTPEPEHADAEPGGISAHGDKLSISRFAYRRGLSEAVVHHGTAGVLSVVPTRFLLGGTGRLGLVGWLPLKHIGVVAVDALGTPAWENMHRRTRTMFRSANEFQRTSEGAQDFAPPAGAVAVFLDELQRLVREDSTTRYEITLVGHSMGAIVASEMVRSAEALPWNNIVFMAPAVSSREFEMSVLPYLQRNDDARFYVLTLHPFAERRESNFYRLAPHGSLLEWIDAYFGHPETDLDRMMGKYDNVVNASVIIPDSVRARVHIKAFGYGDGSGCGKDNAYPYKHGDFNQAGVPYWRPAFWHPGHIGCEEIKRMTAELAPTIR
jgi:pimeloyl-ACP methyl ester carboxylesterase